MWKGGDRIKPIQLFVGFRLQESRPLTSGSSTTQVRSSARDDSAVARWRNEVAIANETMEMSPIESRELVRVEPSSSPSAHKDVELRAYFDTLKSTVKDEAWKADYEIVYEVVCRERFTVDMLRTIQPSFLHSQGVKWGIALDVGRKIGRSQDGISEAFVGLDIAGR